jgi:glycosyltransferase involved in cell wall biosynthesis
VVASYHTDLPRYLPGYGLQWLAPAIWPLLRAIHNRAHVNLCPSRFTRDELHAHGVEPVGIWRGGVDTELFHPEQRRAGMRARLAGGWPTGPILLYVGRLSPEKRLDTLEPALDAIPGANLAIVGDGPARADLEQQYAGRPVSFLGFLRGEELASAFASADLFVMPSTTETLGFVTLEAMASGLPVVAAHAGGILDVVEHGETGLLYDPDQPLQAAARAREILEDDVLRHYLATQARKRAEEASWLSETRKLVLEYRRARLLRAERSVLRRAYDAVV